MGDTGTDHQLKGTVETAPEAVSMRSLRRAQLGRRAGITALVVFLGLGLAGVYGPKTTTVTATSGPWRLTVEYASISRPALATPWAVVVQHEGGFDGPITIATTTSYFEIFDENGLDPDAAAATTDGEWSIWEFDPPPGETLRVYFDARVEPAAQSGRTATTRVLVRGEPVVEVTYRTRLMP